LAHLLGAALAIAPVLDGGPLIRSDQIGSAISDFGGRFAIKSQVTGASEDRLGALAFYDTRSGPSRDLPIGGFALDVSDANANPRLRTGRKLTFDPLGWSEAVTAGPLSASVR